MNILKKTTFLTLIILITSTPSYAGPTVASIETALGEAQHIIQSISTQLSKLFKDDKDKENKQYGTPSQNSKKEKAVKNETLIDGQDATPLVPSFLTTELSKDNPDVTAIHETVKEKLLIDPKTIYVEGPFDLNSALDIKYMDGKKVKNTAVADSVIPNSQEAMQSSNHLTLEQGRAIAQKSFDLMSNQKDFKNQQKKDTQSRETMVAKEKGNALANQSIADILNEILVIRAMGLEIEGLQLMQSQQKSTVK